eukprot:RCo036979
MAALLSLLWPSGVPWEVLPSRWDWRSPSLRNPRSDSLLYSAMAPAWTVSRPMFLYIASNTSSVASTANAFIAQRDAVRWTRALYTIRHEPGSPFFRTNAAPLEVPIPETAEWRSVCIEVPPRCRPTLGKFLQQASPEIFAFPQCNTRATLFTEMAAG